MGFSAKLRGLIDAAAPYWAGEAAVFEAYWNWTKRTRETDLAWLNHQCFKEIWGSGVADRNLGLFLGPLEELKAAFPKIDVEIDRHAVLDTAEALWAEFAHYCAFADAHDGLLLPGEQKINPGRLKWWKEDEVLAHLRYGHIERHGALGRRAARFTEGGYCTLFSAGMQLKERPTPGRERVDGLIATACGKVYDDEFGHMLKGIAGLDVEGLTDAEWGTLEGISIEQLRCRILMRNAQFGSPLAGARLDDALAGRLKPVSFDYGRAGSLRDR
jgi:hypothetical protein